MLLYRVFFDINNRCFLSCTIFSLRLVLLDHRFIVTNDTRHLVNGFRNDRPVNDNFNVSFSIQVRLSFEFIMKLFHRYLNEGCTSYREVLSVGIIENGEVDTIENGRNEKDHSPTRMSINRVFRQTHFAMWDHYEFWIMSFLCMCARISKSIIS